MIIGEARPIERDWVNREETAMGIVGNLSPDQLQSFKSQGYLVIESFASGEDTEAMMKRMQQLLDDFDCSSTASIFSTKNQQQSTDDYFFDSVDKVSFFFEEKAFGEDGSLKQPKQLSINKVGHALHEIEPAFKKFSSSEKISRLMYSLGYKRPVIMQSMYIFKQPGIGGEVVPHQDNSFLYTEPQTCTGLWLALEDANILNGCLWAIPGSHKNGLLRRFLRDDDGVKFDRPSPSYDQKDFVPIEVKAGSLVVIHGDLIHQSFENQSPKSRHAYSLHVVDTDGCKWAPENWIRQKVEPEPLYVDVPSLLASAQKRPWKKQFPPSPGDDASGVLLLCDFGTSRRHSWLQSYQTGAAVKLFAGFVQLLVSWFPVYTIPQGLATELVLDSTLNFAGTAH